MKLLFDLSASEARALKGLPWDTPLESWKPVDARFLPVRSGLSRHVVRFIRVGRREFAIKETSPGAARHELDVYRRLRSLKIPTLKPTGMVTRNEGQVLVPTPCGPQPEEHSSALLITELLDHALPNSYLYGRAFSVSNRRTIWDAVLRLFVQLHSHGVYWGDASFANMLVVFANEHFPEVGVRTVLRAVLADAETVEFHPVLSPQMRMADIEYFLESMAWTEADLRASGVVRDPLLTKADREYLMQRYVDLFQIEREEESFTLITKIDVDSLIGPFQTTGQAKAILKHIYEHRWYLSELAGKEIPIEEAARHWYHDVFKPVLILFGEFGIPEDIRDRTAASLYLEIMLHKYYLSERVGRDVGLIPAFRDYARRYVRNRPLLEKLSRIGEAIQRGITGGKGSLLAGLSSGKAAAAPKRRRSATR